jgi:hypothetical protein
MFIKYMIGKGVNMSPDEKQIINYGNIIEAQKDKAETFLDCFCKVHPSSIPINSHFERTITNSRRCTDNP